MSTRWNAGKILTWNRSAVEAFDQSDKGFSIHDAVNHRLAQLFLTDEDDNAHECKRVVDALRERSHAALAGVRDESLGTVFDFAVSDAFYRGVAVAYLMLRR